MPTATEVLHLYRSFLRDSAHFPNYNIREYIRRRARESFKEAKDITDASKIEALWKHAKQQLEVVKRQSVVYGLYARSLKSIVEKAPKK